MRECIFSHEKPKAHPDPMPTCAHFTGTGPLCYVGKIGLTRFGPPGPSSGSATVPNIASCTACAFN